MKKSISLLMSSVLLVSCSVGPFTYANKIKGVEVTSTGASFLTKSDREETYVQKGDFVSNHVVVKKNETSVANNAILAGATVAAAEAAAETAKVVSNNKLAETVAENATKVQLAEQAAKVEAARHAAEEAARLGVQ